MEDRGGRHGNRMNHGPVHAPVEVHKVPADSVPYGDAITQYGGCVWCAYDDGVLVCVAATAPEARRKYREWAAHRRERAAK